uniref:Protein HUA2-LIKE 3-like n=1 Tax=Tanacetum cinerariifolium TaxID=118510 RepID=A0A6L2L3R8_TANCI|nr:hypothetical protein [Tanacetum cinerariifolium]
MIADSAIASIVSVLWLQPRYAIQSARMSVSCRGIYTNAAMAVSLALQACMVVSAKMSRLSLDQPSLSSGLFLTNWASSVCHQGCFVEFWWWGYMAPSRKKGVNKAAAAAAACRRWKEGDLVLAKMKGYPTWPAKVSDPVKWGYTADVKKVLVFFFGTQQIAFCGPADLEAFTEEKKDSLLGKRHGKGSDFGRAVREIIDSYEELRKQEQVDGDITLGQTVSTNGGKSEECVASSGSKDEAIAPTADSSPKMSISSKLNDALATQDVIQKGNKMSDGNNGNSAVTKAHLPTTYSRKKHSGTQTSAINGKVPSARRARSSCIYQNRTVSSEDVVMNNDCLHSISREGTRRRNKRARTSPISSDELGSNASPEENGSEIVAGESDTKCVNEVNSEQSNYQVMEHEYAMECSGGDMQLSQRLEFQNKAVIVKKKRKPSRKRAITVTTEFPDRTEKQSVSGIKIDKTEAPQNDDLENSRGKFSKENGDEHLPLVKRARVRMGRTSLSSEATNKPRQDCRIISDAEDISVEGKPMAVTDVPDPSFALRKCTVNRPPLWEATKNKNFGCLADGEAALPPSKRLHRALEAMSANVAEDEPISPGGQSALKTVVNGSLSQKGTEESVVQKPNSPSNGVCRNLPPPVEQNETVDEVNTCSQPSGTSSSPSQKVVEIAYSKDSVMLHSCNGTAETVSVLEIPKPSSDAIENKEPPSECNDTSVVSLAHSINECEFETSELKEGSKKDPSDVSGMHSDPVSSNMENGAVLHDVNLLQSSPQKSCNDNAILEDTEATKKANMEVDNFSSPINVAELKTVVPGPEPSHSSVIIEDSLSHKTVSGTLASPLPTDGLDSSARVSPRNTTISNMTTSDNSTLPENTSSPAVNEKPKPTGNWSIISEGNAALTSFEASLAALTRTKKTIDRSTRLAIDCAKFGIAVKVVETIARSLEAETSLHKRVDLFFLVDSIAQCSRGLRGEVGGLYPSAIQAVLPRLLLAAAPPGSSALENRRQCLKVLKLWQERKILPEPMIRHHIRELDSLNNMSSRIGNSSRRPFRNERAFDDPIREVEDMLVDEYGSNSSIQLSGFCMPTMLKDEKEESDSDEEGFEAVTPERDPQISEERDRVPTPAAEKHTHVLEDVDGELEMEDVSPSREGEITFLDNSASKSAAIAHLQIRRDLPPLPIDMPPSFPPLPISHPPPPGVSHPPPPPSASLPPPPPAPLPAPPPISDTLGNSADANPYAANQNGDGDLQQSTSQSVHFHPVEGRDPRMDIQVPEPSSSSSFSSLPVPRPPVQANGPLRPPHPAPSSQFSYVQSDQSTRDIPPPSYPGRFHFVNSTDTENCHSDHDRMHVPPHDDSWRFPPPPYSGPCLPDGPRGRYPPNMYHGPPYEPPMSNNGWHYPVRPVNHRETGPHRPYPDAPVPMGSRGPNYWRPR